jgi:iron(III) transport system permease protein
VTLPLLKPGLANAFLVGFIESMADFGNPIVVGGQFSVLSTEIFFAIVGAQYDQGRAASLAWLLTLFALAVFALQRLLRRRSLRHRGRQGRRGRADGAADGVRRLVTAIAVPWIAFTLLVYLFAFAGGFVQTWGRDYTPTLAHFRTAFAVEWGAFGAGVGRHGVELASHHAQAGRHLGAADGGLGLLIAWVLARTSFRGQRRVRVLGAAGVRDSRHGAGPELHPGLQRAAVRADRHRH